MSQLAKVLVITGASTGIGEATAKHFAEHNVKVYNFDVKMPQYQHAQIETLVCNTAKYDDIKTCFDMVMSKEKFLDYLFVNAGVHVLSTMDETTIEDINRVVDINVKGYLYTLKCALAIMKKQKDGGVIVLTGSDTSFIGKSAMTVYGCTKAAIANMAKSICIDYAKYHIRINCVCPGPVDTPLARHCAEVSAKKSGISFEEAWKAVPKGQPIHQFCTPEEIAHMVYFLCSDATPFMTGASISIDGGYTAQ